MLLESKAIRSSQHWIREEGGSEGLTLSIYPISLSFLCGANNYWHCVQFWLVLVSICLRHGILHDIFKSLAFFYLPSTITAYCRWLRYIMSTLRSLPFMGISVVSYAQYSTICFLTEAASVCTVKFCYNWCALDNFAICFDYDQTLGIPKSAHI